MDSFRLIKGEYMSEITRAFGANLRSIRLAKGFSQVRLALAADIDRSYLGRVERGEVNITIEKLYTIARVLECSPKELLPE
jgi:transcriptional regulator with XRE-family HTH domain